jgi:hypothetical protein
MAGEIREREKIEVSKVFVFPGEIGFTVALPYSTDNSNRCAIYLFGLMK